MLAVLPYGRIALLLVRQDCLQSSWLAIFTVSRLASKQTRKPDVHAASRCHFQKTIAAIQNLLQQGGRQDGLQS
jgi:hypothetical protein